MKAIASSASECMIKKWKKEIKVRKNYLFNNKKSDKTIENKIDIVVEIYFLKKFNFFRFISTNPIYFRKESLFRISKKNLTTIM